MELRINRVRIKRARPVCIVSIITNKRIWGVFTHSRALPFNQGISICNYTNSTSGIRVVFTARMSFHVAIWLLKKSTNIGRFVCDIMLILVEYADLTWWAVYLLGINMILRILFMKLLPPANEGNVFTGVYLSFCSWGGGSHVTITFDALDLTVQAPRSPHGLGISLVVTSDGHYWRPVQTCSLHDPTPFLLHRCRHLAAIKAHTVCASGRYASYWNAFLFKNPFAITMDNSVSKNARKPGVKQQQWAVDSWNAWIGIVSLLWNT